MAKTTDGARPLQGWKEIAEFLGQPVSVAQRWAKSGMPMDRKGRRVYASEEELNRWLGRESAEPIHIASEDSDLAGELKQSVSYFRKQSRNQRRKRKAA